MTTAHLQRIGTATPPHDVHAAFVGYARSLLEGDRERLLFDRMAERSGIAHRWSMLRPGDLAAGQIDADGFYRPGNFPGTAARMKRYVHEALPLALQAVQALAPPGELQPLLARVTHLVLASCTGFVAPGLDVLLVDALGLAPDVQRSCIGFMGCSAALPALRSAAHTVAAEPGAQVLVVNVELCSLHLRESHQIDELLSFLLFGDAASAALVGARPEGMALHGFRTRLLPDSRGLITWDIGDHGFEMHLSGLVPGRIAEALAMERARRGPGALLHGLGLGLGRDDDGAAMADAALWAVHAGGRTVLDAVQRGLALPPAALADSRAVLQAVGNVSSATVMFVLQRMLAAAHPPGTPGVAMAFGPGLTAEVIGLRIVGPNT